MLSGRPPRRAATFENITNSYTIKIIIIRLILLSSLIFRKNEVYILLWKLPALYNIDKRVAALRIYAVKMLRK